MVDMAQAVSAAVGAAAASVACILLHSTRLGGQREAPQAAPKGSESETPPAADAPSTTAPATGGGASYASWTAQPTTVRVSYEQLKAEFTRVLAACGLAADRAALVGELIVSLESASDCVGRSQRTLPPCPGCP